LIEEMKEELNKIKNGDVVVNLGAHRGKMTTYFSKLVGKEGLVISLEPSVENYKILVETIIKEKLLNAIPLCTAVGKYTGTAMLYMGGLHVGYTLFRKKLVFEKETNITTQFTPVICWDDLVVMLGLTHVDFVKVDIEGSEEQFLEGMQTVFPERMIIEEHSRCGVTNLNHLKELLENRGYRIIKHKSYLLYVSRGAN